jgi:hypothetical protein
MKILLTLRKVPLALALAGLAVHSWALTLGPATGTAVVGEPLALGARVELDSPGQGSACLHAQVLYGETPLGPQQVRLGFDVTGLVGMARITSAVPVNEPVVTLVLHAGCQNPVVRRYVMLADAPGTTPSAAPLASASLRPPAAPVPVARAAPLRSAAAEPVARVLPSAKTRLATVRAAAPVRRNRLQLDAWDPAVPPPGLRVSYDLPQRPVATEAHRAAATALWQALNADPVQILRTSERLGQLEAEIAGLRSLAQRSRSDLTTLRTSLDQVQAQRQSDSWIAVAILALATAAGALIWRSRRAAASRGAWWSAAEDSSLSSAPDSELQPAPRDPPAPVAAASPVVRAAALAPPAPEAAPPACVAAVQSEHAPGPVLKMEALHAAQQQAQFFSSLGQHDEAVLVLDGYIADSSDPAPLAWMELLGLHHRQQNLGSFQGVSASFQAYFGVPAPAYEEFGDNPNPDARTPLEAHPRALSRIQANWPSPAVLDVLEELLFTPPAQQPMHIDAQRELLWLHAVAQAVLQSSHKPAGLALQDSEGLSTHHFILPLDAEDSHCELTIDRLDRNDLAPASAAFAVDVDLSDWPAPHAAGIGEPAQTGSGAYLVAAVERHAAFDEATGAERRRPFASQEPST